jgi:hypothetical protein
MWRIYSNPDPHGAHRKLKLETFVTIEGHFLMLVQENVYPTLKSYEDEINNSNYGHYI